MNLCLNDIVMTRGKDDEKALYDLLGNKDDRKKFDNQFKKAESNFKIGSWSTCG
jgi:type I restriction enzyme, R subunit